MRSSELITQLGSPQSKVATGTT